MATKSTQRDDGTVVDAETTRAQKGYANYEKDQQEAQKKLESEDAAMKQKFKTSIEKIRGVIGMKKGGKVKKYEEGGDVFSKAEPYLKKAVEKMDKSLGITKETSPELRKSFAEKLEKLSKSSGGSGGGMGPGKMSRDITKAYKAGGMIKSSASKRADGCAIRGKTRA